jgi:hypothetical protein
MQLIVRTAVAALLSLAIVPCLAAAAPLKTYVAEFRATGVPKGDELGVTLQAMLASRLDPKQAVLVDRQEKAQLLITGSYAQFGKMFSLDLLLKRTGTDTISKVFEQGEGADDLIPAMNRMAQKIGQELAQFPQETALAPAAVLPPAIVAPQPPAPAAPPSAPTRTEGYVVHQEIPVNVPGFWNSEPLDGLFSGIALGRTLASGEREIFMATDHEVRAYRQGTGLKLEATVTVPLPARILAIDTADLDHDGVPELYVTIMDRESISSRIYRADGAHLEELAHNLPWFFRGMGADLGSRTIFVQAMALDGRFTGEVMELAKSGTGFVPGKPLRLPPHGTIYNFSRFSDQSGKGYLVVLTDDGFLIVSTADGEELWRSSQKFGGSEVAFKRRDYSQKLATGDVYRWTFLEQRMIPLSDGTLLVPRNEGIFVVGNSRSYDKHTVVALRWNGSMLIEKWHTREIPCYLADFAYDAASRELVLLEVVKKPGLFGTGKSVIAVNRAE